MTDADGTGDGATEQADDEGRSTLFWVAIAVLVAIPVVLVGTVILAAVVGAFVLGFGGGEAAAPQVTWEVDEEVKNGNLEVTFTHQGGEAIDLGSDELRVVPWDERYASSLGGTVDGGVVTSAAASDGGHLRAGDSVTVVYSADGDHPEPGDDVQLVWSGADSDEESVVAIHTIATAPRDA